IAANINYRYLNNVNISKINIITRANKLQHIICVIKAAVVTDIGGYGDNSLTVTAQDVLDVTESQNQLLILGDAGDTVTSTGQGWVYQGDIVHIDGETLHYYFDGEANLYVDDDITQLIS
ncbi:MAG TPA: hypothetical protein P5227_12645, partial [Emcibacteraceae bacterium]|nr:hypothetical protein [Emcibacteraceae bacterium]